MTHEEAVKISNGGNGYIVSTLLDMDKKIEELKEKIKYLENLIENQE